MLKIQLHAYVLAAILGTGLLIARSSKPLSVEGRTKTDFNMIPMEIGGWIGSEGRFDARTYELLPSCSLLVRYYEHPEYPTVDLAIVYGTDLGDFHQPEICLGGQGLRVVNKKKITIATKEDTFQAITLITDSDVGRRAFLFWFGGSGQASTFLGDYKVRVFLQRMRVRKVQPSALIRFSTEVVDTDQEAIDRMVGFVKDIYPYLMKEFEADASHG